MKKILFVLLAMMAMTAAQAKLGFKYGVEAGLDLNKMKFDKSGYGSNNRAGYFFGLKGKVTIPVAGLGLDAALLYNNKSMSVDGDNSEGVDATKTKHLSYVNIPVNVRYTYGLGSKASLFVATGPQWNWYIGSSKKLAGTFAQPVTDENGALLGVEMPEITHSACSWNVGVGANLLSHLELGVTYNIGIGDSMNSLFQGAYNATKNAFKAKNNSAQVRVAYYF